MVHFVNLRVTRGSTRDLLNDPLDCSNKKSISINTVSIECRKL